MPNSSGKSDSPRTVHPPFAQPDPGRRRKSTHTRSFSTEPFQTGGFNIERSNAGESYAGATEADGTAVEALPNIDEFLDDLPMIDDFLLMSDRGKVQGGESRERVASEEQRAASAAGNETDWEGWADADWRSYDWSGLSSLGAQPPEALEANAAWSSTSWDSTARNPGAVSRSPGRTIEDEVAEALDEIARRIRSGELSLEQFRGTPPEAAIATVVAALLWSRG